MKLQDHDHLPLLYLPLLNPASSVSTPLFPISPALVRSPAITTSRHRLTCFSPHVPSSSESQSRLHPQEPMSHNQPRGKVVATMSLPLSVSLSLSLGLSVCLPVCLTLCFSVSRACVSICLSVSVSVSVSVSLSLSFPLSLPVMVEVKKVKMKRFPLQPQWLLAMQSRYNGRNNGFKSSFYKNLPGTSGSTVF
eukprot:761363-Hanusia_phi.AAC.5